MNMPAGNLSGCRYRILFFVERDLHLPFLEPIFDWLKAHADCDLAFAIPGYQESFEHTPGYGLPLPEMRRLAEKGRLVESIDEFQCDAIVCADSCTYLKGHGKLVFVGHGIISKGGVYSLSPIVRRENMADLICVPGQLHLEIMQKNVFSPIRVTGFIKSDRMFANGVPTRAEARIRMGLPEQGSVVLYAPTFNPEMSSIYVLGEQVVELCEAGVLLIVKLHTLTDRFWKERFRTLALRIPNLHYCEEIDVTPSMLASDILVTDVSSVMAEFMFLDRPVIVVDNPRLSEYAYYFPDDLEYHVRDAAAVRVGSIAELKREVLRSLDNPEMLSGKRRTVANALCYGRDGHAAERCAREIIELLSQPALPPDTRCTVLVDWPLPTTPEMATQYENHLREENSDVVIRCLHRGLTHQTNGLVRCSLLNWLDDLENFAGDCDYLVIVKSGVQYPSGWMRRLSLHLRWNEHAALVQPLSHTQELHHLIGNLLPDNSTEIDYGQLSKQLFLSSCGIDKILEHPHDQCVLLKRCFAVSLTNFPEPNIECICRTLMDDSTITGENCYQAVDILSWGDPSFSSLNQEKPEYDGKLLNYNPEPDKQEFSIIIPLYNRLVFTRQCLEALLAAPYTVSHAEIIVVDNGSKDATAAYLQTLAGQIRIITNDCNLGFAVACNQGAQAATKKHLVFLNNDTIVHQGWLETLASEAEHAQAAIAGAKLLYPDGTIQHAGVAFNRDMGPYHIFSGFSGNDPAVTGKRFMQAVSAACMLVERQLFLRLRGFDEGYVNGFEDVDFCLRAGEDGARVLYVPESVVTHFESASEGRKLHDAFNLARFRKRWGQRIRYDDEEFYQSEGITMVKTPDGGIFIERIMPLPLSIVVPQYGGAALTSACIKSLQAYTDISFEIIISDDASPDNAVHELSDHFGVDARVRFITSPVNTGFAATCNRGAKAALGQYLCFLNNDTEVTAGWLKPLLSTLDRHPDIGMVGPKLIFPDGTIQHCGKVWGNDSASPISQPQHIYYCREATFPGACKSREFNFLTAACIIVRRDEFLRIGPFDEGYKNGWEDDDLCCAYRQAGMRLVYSAESTVIHHQSKTLDRLKQQSLLADPLEPVRQRFDHNRRRFFERWGGMLVQDDIRYYVEDGLLPASL